MSEKLSAQLTDDGLVMTRRVAAPPALVFASWTEAQRLKHWWGPKGFEWVSCTLDLRPGGLFHYHLRGPAGHEMWGKFVYGRIEPVGLLEFTVSFSDENAATVRAPFNANWPLEVFNSVTFTEQDGGTLVTLRGGPVNASLEEIETYRANLASMEAGFGGTFDQLDDYLAQAQQ